MNNPNTTILSAPIRHFFYFISEKTLHLPVDDIGFVKPSNGIIPIDLFNLVFYRAEDVSHDDEIMSGSVTMCDSNKTRARDHNCHQTRWR